MADTYLSVVDAEDTVVGRELRSVVHRDGLRHREVHVWLLGADGNLILQKRGPGKDTYPNLLDASAGGHVEEGQSYLEAALAEAREELGLSLHADDLVPVAKIDITQVDRDSGTHNVVFRSIYACRFAGGPEDLQVEAGDGAGFERVPLEAMASGGGAWRDKVVPGLLREAYQPVWEELKKLVSV